MKSKSYWPINKLSLEVLSMCQAEYRGGMYHIPKNALQSEPLPPKQGFAVIALLDESGKAVASDYIEDHRGVTIYDKLDCTHSETSSELGFIKDGFTQDKPTTQFDEWINNVWVTNLSNKYIADYDAIDSPRRALYREVSDPLYMESYRKKENGEFEEAAIFKSQADAAVQQIQIKNPFPTPPIN